MQNLFRRLLFHYWYFRQPPWDTGSSPPELLEFIENHKPGRAIDIGCGTGTNVVTLVRAGWQVTGVDFAPRAIHLAKQKLKNAGLQAELFVNDATELRGISGPYQLALDIGCFHGLPQNSQNKYLLELDRLLAPSGFWLMYGFLKSDSDHTSAGLAEPDISRISSQFIVLCRMEGFDQKERPSTWFLFQKPHQP